jgi:hypothetical protein
MYPDRDPAIFVIDIQDANRKLNKKKSFYAYYFLKLHLRNFSKIKSPKDVTKQQESRFFFLFLLYDRRIRIRSSDLQIRIQEAFRRQIPEPGGKR